MSTALVINSSANVTDSKTRQGVQSVLSTMNPETIIKRDLTAPLPHVTDHWITARLVDPENRSDADHDVLKLSDDLIAEIQAADTLIIGMPIYNFGIPASLKAWIDLIARPRVTFRYTENGPQGLMQGKRAIVVAASGGVPLNSEMDFATPHLIHVLKFIGITDVTLIDTKDPHAVERLAA